MARSHAGLFVDMGADFSPCRTWRYRLWRIWEPAKPSVLFLMLNPSTADETRNDPTVERCQRYAVRWGYGGLYVCNLFALRSTEPRELYSHQDPIGPQNDAAILATAAKSGMVVCAWGEHGSLRERNGEVQEMLRRHGIALSCLRLTKRGHPCHPLYLPKDLRAMSYKPRRKNLDDGQ